MVRTRRDRRTHSETSKPAPAELGRAPSTIIFRSCLGELPAGSTRRKAEAKTTGPRSPCAS